MAGMTPTGASPAAHSPNPHSPSTQPWTPAQSRAQFAALATLRWCIFRNSFRRKGGVGELIARVIVYPLIGIVALGPIAGSALAAYFIVSSGHIARLPLLTWGLFLLWQIVVLNLTPPGLSFDVNTIIRFPLSFPRYLAARLVFGLLSASNVIGTLALIAADIGIIAARPSLALWSTLLLGSFALANIFFTRMILVWIDRWLSTRRAREIFTACFLFASLGFQYLNLNFNPGMQGRHHRHPSTHLPLFRSIFHHIEPIAALLPPGLTASSIISYRQGHLLSAIAALLGLILFGALFFSIYAWRMHREFRGENLSELTQTQQPPAPRSPTPAARAATLSTSTAAPRSRSFGLNPTVIACLNKEFLYLRRNMNQLYGFIVPIFMVFLFAGRMSASERFGGFIFPVAVAYSILGVSILSYNSLGVDGPGVQFYFLSPTRMRDVFLAKNLMGFLLNFIELVLIFTVISTIASPPPPVIAIATVCWLLFTTFLNGTAGNLRSLSAPKKVDLSKVSRKQTSQLSVLIALGVIFACVGVGYGVFHLSTALHRPWLMIPIFLALALLSFVLYLQVLSRLDTIALTHREALAEELAKA